MKLSQIILCVLLGLIVFSCIITVARCQQDEEEVTTSAEDEVPIEQQQPTEETLSGYTSNTDVVATSILLTKGMYSIDQHNH
jgi:hypothetical protein